MFFILWRHCSGQNGLVTSNMAPAHPHATGVAVYPALLSLFDTNPYDLGLQSQKKNGHLISLWRPLLVLGYHLVSRLCYVDQVNSNNHFPEMHVPVFLASLNSREMNEAYLFLGPLRTLFYSLVCWCSLYWKPQRRFPMCWWLPPLLQLCHHSSVLCRSILGIHCPGNFHHSFILRPGRQKHRPSCYIQLKSRIYRKIEIMSEIKKEKRTRESSNHDKWGLRFNHLFVYVRTLFS